MIRLFSAVLLLELTACQTSGAQSVVGHAPSPIVEIVVANQQSASASLIEGEGAARHVPMVDLVTMTEARRVAVQASPDGVAVGWRR